MKPYVVYVFLGLAEAAEAKIYREPQWQHLFSLMSPVFRPFGKSVVVIPNLVFEVPMPARKHDPPGTRRVTYKNVPTGRLKWSEPDCERLTGWFSEPSEFPVVHIETTVLSSSSTRQPPEVMLRVLNRDAAPTSLYNQILILVLSEQSYAADSGEEWNGLIHHLGSLMRAVRILKCVRPFSLTRPQGAYTVMSTLRDETFSLRHDNLEPDDAWQQWEIVQ